MHNDCDRKEKRLKKRFIFSFCVWITFLLTACSTESLQEDVRRKQEEDIEMKMNVQIGDYTFAATLEDNAAVDAFAEMMKEESIVIQMRDYSGFEKVGSLGRDLPSSDIQMVTKAGDIVLYNGNQIVMFYGSNSWRYTRIGKIDDLSDWEEALGSGDVAVTFSIEE